jgi:tetratricopeptide (TPR) repeat protein
VAGILLVLALPLIAVAVQRATHRPSGAAVLVLIAAIDGPQDETAAIPEQLATQLTQALAVLPGVRVQRVSQRMIGPDGPRGARELGRRYRAAIVIWGGVVQGATAPAVFVEVLTPWAAVPFLRVKDYLTEAVLLEPDQVSFSALAPGQGHSVGEFVSGLIHYRRADYAQALDHLTSALDDNGAPDVVSKVLMSRGNVRLALGQTDLAIADYSRALQLNPDLVGAYANRGTAFLMRAEEVRAAADFARVPQGARPPIQGNRAAAAAAHGQYQAAQEEAQQVLQTNPEDRPAYLTRGVVRALLGDHPHAREDFSRALQLDPIDATAYYDRGLSYAAQGDQRHAIDDYSAALRITPHHAPAYYARGVAYAALEKYAQAVEDLTHAIQLNPKYGPAYRDRGASHLLSGNSDQAIADATTAISLDPTDATAYFTRGLSYIVRGVPQQAIADMKKVLEVGTEPALRKNAEEQLRRLQKEE